MKILYIGPFRFPEGDAAASRVLNNIRILRDLGHFVRVLSFGGVYKNEDKCGNEYIYDSIIYTITNDIDTHSWKERLLRYIYPYPNARKFIKEHINNYDVLITYNTTLLMNIFLQNICNKYSKKLVLDLTEWPAANETPGGKLCPIYWMSECNMRYIQKRFKNLILISEYLNRYYCKSNNILLPPLIDIKENKWNFFSEIEDSRITKFQGVRIVFAGNPAKKDLLRNLIIALLRILKETKRVQLIVAGVSEKQALKYCSQEELAKFRDNFVFLGHIPQALVPSVYHISDFSAIIREPSRKNTAGFPTKMAESMAAGCPVLLNLTSDLASFSKNKENVIIIQDYSIDCIEDGLREILSMDKAKISIMKKSARQVGEAEFDYRVYIEKMKFFISRLK